MAGSSERAPGPGSAVATVGRLAAVDNLRATLIAWVIAGHALLGYSALGGWTYAEVTETTFAQAVELVLAVLLGASALFVLGTLFLLAGLFTPGSLEHKGARRFAVDRAVRLGVPFLANTLLLWPVSVWLTYRAAGRPVSIWWVLTGRGALLDSGALWFVGVLLLYSLCYAAWRAGRGRQTAGRVPTGRLLVTLAVVIALSTFVVRLVFPMNSEQAVDLHLWQWPQLVVMFGLGIAIADTGFAREVPARLRRACGFALLGVLVLMPVLAVVAGVSELATDVAPFLGGWHWQALCVALIEGALVIAGSVWLLGLAQRRLTGSGRVARIAGRSSYAAFIAQGPVLLALAVAARPLAAPAEVKAVLVAACGVLMCFWIGWLAVTRTRLGRFL